MILWIALFILIIGISFVLALQSMKDYQEIPQQSKTEYGLFLIRQTTAFTPGLLNSLHHIMLKKGLVISIERLFKGHKAALTLFGPKEILVQYSNQLDLLELEDYTLNLDGKNIHAWEVGVKEANRLNTKLVSDIFKDLPVLADEDQFFWQIILGAKRDKNFLFQTQIRAIVYSKDPQRQKTNGPLFQNLSLGELVKVPRPFGTEQIVNFFKLRSLSQDSNGPILDSNGVVSLLRV